MMDRDNIKKIMLKMTSDTFHNIKIIIKNFNSINYCDNENQSLLHIFVDDKYDEKHCFYAIKSLLTIGLNPNLNDKDNCNFIQTALYSGYSEEFIIKIINESIKYGLDVNHIDNDNNTILHTAIYSDMYDQSINSIYTLLCANGFNSSKTDSEGKTILEAMISKSKFTSEQIKTFKQIFLPNLRKANALMNSFEHSCDSINLQLQENDKLGINLFCQVLNNKSYEYAPTIGREKELKKLMIVLAQERKNPILLGDDGVGKEAIVNELAYRIQNGKTPSFLQKENILQITASTMVAESKYAGMLENKMINLLKSCENNNVIIFIDEIHALYGFGSSRYNDMASILKYYIQRGNIKTIGTTTIAEYNKYIKNSPLNKNFEKIFIEEPDKVKLFQIINKVISDYEIKTNIYFRNENVKNQIINIIIKSTGEKQRVLDYSINNPELAIEIIDKAFATAKVYNSKFVDIDHFIISYSYCNRINGVAVRIAIEKLKKLDSYSYKPAEKILKIDFSKHIR